jgi:hypothetical protein
LVHEKSLAGGGYEQEKTQHLCGQFGNFHFFALFCWQCGKIPPCSRRCQQAAQNQTNTNTMQTKTSPTLRVVRGSYQHASDDCLSRWYIQDDDGPVNRQGKGYRTRRLAMDALGAMRLGPEWAIDWRAMPTD